MAADGVVQDAVNSEPADLSPLLLTLPPPLHLSMSPSVGTRSWRKSGRHSPRIISSNMGRRIPACRPLRSPVEGAVRCCMPGKPFFLLTYFMIYCTFKVPYRYPTGRFVKKVMILSCRHFKHYFNVHSGVDPHPHRSALNWRSWIRIQITITEPDPDPGTWKLIKITNKPGFLPFKKAFVSS